MKIGIVGSEKVGQTLARSSADEGHDVHIGSREGSKLQAFAAQTGIQEKRFAEIAAFADVVVLAVKGDVTESLVRELTTALDGKAVLDTTNPISGPRTGGIVPYFTAANKSLVQRLRTAAPAQIR